MAVKNYAPPVGKWIAGYARFGYGSKGVLYGSTGLLALLEAFDLTNEEAISSTGVLKTIAIRPLGGMLVTFIAIGLMGYVAWRFIQAFFDPEQEGCGATDIVRRIGYGCSGLVYASIAYSVAEVLTGTLSGSGRTANEWAAMVMSLPFGRWLVGFVGLVFFGVGCYYFYRSIKAEFRKRFKRHKMSDAAKSWASIVGRVGIASRGVVYVVIGLFGMRAAWALDADMIRTSGGVLELFDKKPTDEIILAILGVGFIAYSVHMGFQAAYRDIDPM